MYNILNMGSLTASRWLVAGKYVQHFIYWCKLYKNNIIWLNQCYDAVSIIDNNSATTLGFYQFSIF